MILNGAKKCCCASAYRQSEVYETTKGKVGKEQENYYELFYEINQKLFSFGKSNKGNQKDFKDSEKVLNNCAIKCFDHHSMRTKHN